jgi:hypothetical protein
MHEHSNSLPRWREPTNRSKKRKLLGSAVVAALAVSLGVVVSPSSIGTAASVTPTVIPGGQNTDKTCAVVMPGTLEFKIEPVPDGTNDYSDGFLSVTIVKPSSLAGSVNSFDFTSNILVDGVIVKDGVDGANWYDYLPAGSDGDTYLTTPFDGDKGISHISFCYRPRLEISKTADTSFTRTYTWEIDKSVDVDEWDLFRGDRGTSEYTVELTRTVVDSDFAVAGEITIHNPAPIAATIESVTDVVSPDIAAAVDCGVTYPYSLAALGTLECTYSTDLPDATSRTNTATVTTSGTVVGGTATADVVFGDPTTVVGYPTVNVTDSYEGDLGEFSGSGSTSYSRSFDCDADEGSHPNTATIVETEQSDDADVTVNCYALAVDKDADTALTRTWTWDIEKVGDQTDLVLSEGQVFTVNYEVTVDAESEDSNFAVSGTITVDNPAPIDATINSVSDVISGFAGPVTVDCGAAVFPYVLAAGDPLECTYSADLDDAESRTNTATATLQNYSYDVDGVVEELGTTDFSGTADIDFADATVEEIDECIDVSDDQKGPLGTVCADEAPFTFDYTLDLSYEECGEYTFVNVASFVTNDTGTTGSDDHTVNVNVPCDFGCTLTPGYWKTHSIYGPAPYDDTWALIGEDTPFFLSEQSYYEVLWTPAAGGNAYYILAHAYIAAELNFLNGADPTDVQAAFDAATALFETYTPAEIAALRGPSGNALRSQFIDLATTLDAYNNGLIGPGYCDEDSSSA